MYVSEDTNHFKLYSVFLFVKMVKFLSNFLGSIVLLGIFMAAPFIYYNHCSSEPFNFDKTNKRTGRRTQLIYKEDVWIPNHTLASFELANQMIQIINTKTNRVLTDLVDETTIGSGSNNEKLEKIYKDGINYFRDNIDKTTALGRDTARVFGIEDTWYNDKRKLIWARLEGEKLEKEKQRKEQEKARRRDGEVPKEKPRINDKRVKKTQEGFGYHF